MSTNKLSARMPFFQASYFLMVMILQETNNLDSPIPQATNQVTY
jgi:hypothetical protein